MNKSYTKSQYVHYSREYRDFHFILLNFNFV